MKLTLVRCTSFGSIVNRYMTTQHYAMPIQSFVMQVIDTVLAQQDR
jgi:hypothetical protein